MPVFLFCECCLRIYLSFNYLIYLLILIYSPLKENYINCNCVDSVFLEQNALGNCSCDFSLEVIKQLSAKAEPITSSCLTFEVL